MQTDRKNITPDLVVETASDLIGMEDRLAVITSAGVRLAQPADKGPLYVILNVRTGYVQEAELEALAPGKAVRVLVGDSAAAPYAHLGLAANGTVTPVTTGAALGQHESLKPAAVGGLALVRCSFAPITL